MPKLAPPVLTHMCDLEVELDAICEMGEGSPDRRGISRFGLPRINITLLMGRTDVGGVDSQTKCKFCIKTEVCMEIAEWEATTLT